jgi:hypothetical protein
MVQNSDWGPHLWRILHAGAEKMGRQTSPMLAADELRAWISFLKGTEGIMPCALCRKHYGEWKKERPPEKLAAWSGVYLQSECRKWVWDLHERVNARAGVQSSIMFDSLQTLYGAYKKEDLMKEYDELHRVIQIAIAQGLINGAHWREWVAKFRFLRSLWGL